MINRTFGLHNENEMNVVLGQLCAHFLAYTGAGEPPEDAEMTLPSKHRIQNSSPGSLRLPLGH